jgi:hypothetical protein
MLKRFEEDIEKLKKMFSQFWKEYGSSPEISLIRKIFLCAGFKFSTLVPTARIRLIGWTPEITISPQFFTNYIRSHNDIGFLLCHEILHYVLGHFSIEGKNAVKKVGRNTSNLAMDMVINHLLYRIIKEPEKLFVNKFYNDSDCPVELLKPVQSIDTKKLHKKECRDFYDIILSDKLNLSLALKHAEFHMIQEYPAFVELLIEELPEDVVEKVIDELSEILEKSVGNEGGKGGELEEKRVKKKPLPLREKIISKIIDMAEEDANAVVESPFYGEGVLPFYSRTDFVHIPVDVFIPIYHYNPVFDREEKGVKFYIDVSGSIEEYIPFIIGLLNRLNDIISSPIHAVSSRVVPISKKELLNGIFMTTGGTDFDAFAQHVLENRFKKIVFLTDGCDTMSQSNANILKRSCKVLTLLTADGEPEGVINFSSEYVVLEDVEDLATEY